MKKKILTMMLSVMMVFTAESPVSAADFTGEPASAEEFSDGVINDADTPENTDEDETAPEETGNSETDDVIADSKGGITDAEDDSVPVFDDGQESAVTDSAQKPSSSAKYPSMKKGSGDNYTATITNATNKSYVKFVPKKSGKYILTMNITFKNPYTQKTENYTDRVYNVYDSKFKRITDVPQGTYSYYNLEKGKTYYLEGFQGSKVVFKAELSTEITSIKPVGIKKSTIYYTPADFSEYAKEDGGKYYIADRWRGKLKITYSDGKTETISTSGANKYGAGVRHYIIYNGKKALPEAGTYDVHFVIDGSEAEAIVKNVTVKKASSMPTLNNSGKKTFQTSSNGMCVRFKTGKSTKYLISVSFPSYNLGQQGISISTEKNGTMKYVGYVQNGGICTLKANTVYYFSSSLHSGWEKNPTVTFQATPKN